MWESGTWLTLPAGSLWGGVAAGRDADGDSIPDLVIGFAAVDDYPGVALFQSGADLAEP